MTRGLTAAITTLILAAPQANNTAYYYVPATNYGSYTQPSYNQPYNYANYYTQPTYNYSNYTQPGYSYAPSYPSTSYSTQPVTYGYSSGGLTISVQPVNYQPVIIGSNGYSAGYPYGSTGSPYGTNYGTPVYGTNYTSYNGYPIYSTNATYPYGTTYGSYGYTPLLYGSGMTTAQPAQNTQSSMTQGLTMQPSYGYSNGQYAGYYGANNPPTATGYYTGDTDTFGGKICYFPGYGRADCDSNPNQPVYDVWTGTWY